MQRSRRTSVAALVAPLLVVAALSLVGSEARGETTSTAPATLEAGQTLVHHTANMTLRNGDFVLIVGSGGLDLEEHLILHGSRGDETVLTTTWQKIPKHPAGFDETRLTMRRDGNLVLTTSKGQLLWSTRTAGTGTENRLVLGAHGNLNVVTKSGKVVWSAMSGDPFLGAGSVLASGQRVFETLSHDKGAVRQTLTMERGGNLVRRCGTYVLWQSHTHVRGSRMVLRKDGNLVVASPNGRTLWSSHSGGHNSYTYLDVDTMTIHQTVPRLKLLWGAHWKKQC